ncbi:MAG: hypothetical protein L3J52_07430, partial [Proteobacteria bacterium]|nr:hypothetical protein [Pseudomonadota bacterium]
MLDFSWYTHVIFSFFSIFQSAAENGPQVPCLDCEKYTQRTLPKEGLWYNPEQSGSGFNIEIQ